MGLVAVEAREEETVLAGARAEVVEEVAAGNYKNPRAELHLDDGGIRLRFSGIPPITVGECSLQCNFCELGTVQMGIRQRSQFIDD